MWDFEQGEVLAFDKPLHWTSFDLVAKIRAKLCYKLGKKKLKVGHSGTLDPLATGVVIICTGKKTKLIDRLQYDVKEYIATLQLGATTPSYDLEKDIDATYPTAHITRELINQTIPTFKGEQWQVPPMFSAVQINGKRAYELARKGETVELKPKLLLIDEIEVLNFDEEKMQLTIRVVWHIDLPLPIEDLTIPFPHALLATKCEDAGRIVTWCEKEYRYFRFELGKWRWSGKALVGNYPDWRKVIPEQGSLTHIVDFDVDRAEQMATFLKGVPDNPPNNPIALSMGKGSTLRVASEGGMQIDIPASFLTYWGDLKLTVNKTLLLRLLNEGHHRLAIANDSAPFIATGGIGRYIAMPLAPKSQIVQPQTQPKEEK